MTPMQGRPVGTPSMVNRISTAAIGYSYKYNEPGVFYQQVSITYQYSVQRGVLAPRTVNGATMRGR